MRHGFRSRVTLLALAVGLVVSVTGCGSSKTSASDALVQREADTFAIEQIEVKWHKASSTKDIGLMMSLWAPDATFTIGSQTLTGKAQIRDFFAHKAAPFQPENHWVSDTPAYKIRTTVNGDKGTIYFECHYIDVKTGKVANIVGADQNVQKIDGKWLIVNATGATPTLSP